MRTSHDTRHAGPARAPLRARHFSTLLIVACYIPLAVVPWVASCVLSTRPMAPGAPPYQDARGRLSPGDLASVDTWTTAIRALDTAAALVALPVVSAVLAHAAVVVAQRKSVAQNINIRQLLSLADGSWIGLRTNSSTKLSVLGLALISYSIALPLVRSILAAPEAISIASCLDDPSRQFTGPGCDAALPRAFVLAGYDPEPIDINRTPLDLVIPRVASKLATESQASRQIHMWEDGSERGASSSIASLAPNGSARAMFVSAMPSGTNTGVLRQHAMRLNSTVKCSIVGVGEYPENCPGEQSVQGMFSGPAGTVKFCVPGAKGWSLSRNSQTIKEHVFVARTAADSGGATPQSPRANFTARCEAETTRGYFELPNLYNDGRPGPLLASWPSAAELEEQGFSDRLPNGNVPAETDSAELPDQPRPSFPAAPSPFGTRDLATPGPLMTAFMAALGKGSFLDLANKSAAANQMQSALRDMCSTGLPFASLWPNRDSPTNGDCDAVDTIAVDDAARRVSRLVTGWFARISPATEQGRANSEAAISAAVYLANEVLLVQTAEAMGGRGGEGNNDAAAGSRRIYSAPGTVIFKPRDMGLPAQLILSLLLAVQLAVLLALGVAASWSRTVGTRLDAAVMLVAGARMRDDLLQDEVVTASVTASRLGDVDASSALGLGGGHGVHEESPEDVDGFLLPLPSINPKTLEPSRGETPSPPPPFQTGSYKAHVPPPARSSMLPNVEKVVSARPTSRGPSSLGRHASVHLHWIRQGQEAVAAEAPAHLGRLQEPQADAEAQDPGPLPTGYHHHLEGRDSLTRGPYAFHMPSSKLGHRASGGSVPVGTEASATGGAGARAVPARWSAPTPSVAAAAHEDGPSQLLEEEDEEEEEEQGPPQQPPPRNPMRNRASLAAGATRQSASFDPVSPLLDAGATKTF